ncbi:hypothetical protein [Rheinheimera sp.]|jgi:hypothetical protein|uniref:hypothetical protein n=1 Tax=Rheinheimera sp. TaxID=1869214 RepID=UPI002629117F|nr:hypothetical protein [Rheinheimera sp.]MCA1928888.1 hypothetical protein [Rheinheimera sp.]
MAKQIKKASLLSEADKQKLLKKAGNKKPISQTQTASPIQSIRSTSRYATDASEDEQTKASSSFLVKVWLGLVAILLAAFVLAPKPQLLEYQSAGLVTQSIYIPGWFGKPGTILDTNQRAILAEDEQSLYLCFEGQSNEQCAKYQLRKEQGLIAAAMFWYSSRP